MRYMVLVPCMLEFACLLDHWCVQLIVSGEQYGGRLYAVLGRNEECQIKAILLAYINRVLSRV